MTTKNDHIDQQEINNRYKSVVESLITEAQNMMDEGVYDGSVVWRLVDAAGIIAHLNDFKGVGASKPTGRGYLIVKREV